MAPISLIATAIWSAAKATGSALKLPPGRTSPVATMTRDLRSLAVQHSQAGSTFSQATIITRARYHDRAGMITPLFSVSPPRTHSA